MIIKLIILIAIHIVLLVITQFIAWPENLLWPYLNQNGLVFYKDVFVIYPPIYWELLNNFYKIFGTNILSLQVFSYLIIVITDVLIWKASNKKLLPLILFIPIQIFFEGNGIWVDQLLAPVFLGTYMAYQKKSWFLFGALLGICILIKQTAVYFAFAIFVMSLNKGSFMKTIIGGMTVLTLAATYFMINQNFSDFIQTSVVYILSFHSKYELQRQWPSITQTLVTTLVFLPAIFIGIFKRKFLLVVLLVTSSLGIFTRFEYFHLQPALPFLAILLAMSPVGLASWCLFIVFFIKFFVGSFLQTPRFVLSEKVNYVSTGDKTLFINTWDHHYFLTGTKPVGNFFVPSTPWTMDFPGNQERIVKAIKSERPKYIFMNSCFLVKNVCYKPEIIYKYVTDHYSQVEKLSDGTGVFEYDPMSR